MTYVSHFLLQWKKILKKGLKARAKEGVLMFYNHLIISLLKWYSGICISVYSEQDLIPFWMKCLIEAEVGLFNLV